jgi:antitoxin component of RelBE/YafQ-DinJ toxin-antitoxin module
MKEQAKTNLQVQMDVELHNKIKETAKKMGMTTSHLIRQMASDFVKNPNSKIILKKEK